MFNPLPFTYNIPEEDLLNLTKDELIFKYVKSLKVVSGVLDSKPFSKLRLVAQCYNNPFMGLAKYGGELYNRYICDFVLSDNILSYNINIRVPAGVTEDRRSGDIKSSQILTSQQLFSIKVNGFEKFIREYYGFMDIVDGKLNLPFSKSDDIEV